MNDLKILQNSAQNTIHYKEKETILLLQSIDITNTPIPVEEILPIFGKFKDMKKKHFILHV